MGIFLKRVSEELVKKLLPLSFFFATTESLVNQNHRLSHSNVNAARSKCSITYVTFVGVYEFKSIHSTYNFVDKLMRYSICVCSMFLLLLICSSIQY